MNPIRLEKRHLASDLTAGLTFALVNIPQAMAHALLAAVNPVFGLYTLMLATPVGALFTGAAFMNVSSTSAMAVAAGDTLSTYPASAREVALVTLVVLIGIFQVVLGLLRLGWVTRFIPFSVMTGFMTGVAAMIIIGQLGDFTGYYSSESGKIAQVADLVLHRQSMDWTAVAIGLFTIALIYWLGTTRTKKFSLILALLLASGVAVLANQFLATDIRLVKDVADVPRALPKPVLPDPALIGRLIIPAIAVGIIGLVQGAGISLGYTNPDGKYPDVSRDFLSQGIGNLAVSFFQGLPVGGALSNTALVVGAGAKTRLANIITGLFAIVAVLLFAPVIEALPMAGLAAILVIAGVQAINLRRIETVWDTGLAPRVVMVFTFIATLALPIQSAVLLGVLLSFVMHIYRSAEKVEIVEIVLLEGGRYEERPAPKQLPSNQVLLLSPQGSLFFAGAAEFESDLPEIGNAERPVVLLRLRGRAEIGSTFLRVLARYASNLNAHQGKLVLVGVSEPVYQQLEKTELLDQLGKENVYKASPLLGDSALNAYQDAIAWLGVGPVDQVPKTVTP